ncbi:MAG: UvrD/REP helicase [Microgenomates group bacterium GW2011_GWF2_45_18]|nr:MAG: UvrD/REP helicase [Microgenomates group bacterium GW2011_GWF1_44_10]KKU02015.1 MAG: UvrD/REP helicase [Microgenomates group bacterium GW2011_GWF2_45_18]OGJ41200.1 MAG: hypothetical protein A2378_00965 [Candidatus Pacebacteria bacterium RIFOXYB1_FULL_44_10]HAU98999.1 hypothetical protein [Candidatus Paceibacterota bacterium]HAX01287.1 hypothetical protein [Candidatus Paceibacterota bacterium]
MTSFTPNLQDQNAVLSPKFLQELEKLNVHQREAVDQIQGPLMIIAGPGTGKTQTLSMRIANILVQTDANPENILALTFSDAGAHAMKERLFSLIGSTAYRVTFSTFHAFANQIIQDYPDYSSFMHESRPITSLEQMKILKSILANNEFEEVAPFNNPLINIKQIKAAILALKSEGVFSDKLIDLSEQDFSALEQDEKFQKSKAKAKYEKPEKQRAQMRDLAKILDLYNKKIYEFHLYDYEDMILDANRMLREHEVVTSELKERYQYILVDEFQDTNNAQMDLFLALASGEFACENVCVVGDVNQSIYRFQGASTENMIRFAQQFPQAKVVQLQDNYRSTQMILDASEQVISNNRFTHKDVLNFFEHQQLSANNQLQSKQHEREIPVQILEFSSSDLEPILVAQHIQTLIESGVLPEEIAILVQKNRELPVYAEALSRLQIPFEMSGGVDVLHNPIINQFMLLLRVVHSIQTCIENDILFDLLSFEWTHISFSDLLKVYRAYTKQRELRKEKQLFDLLDDDAFLTSSGIADSQQFIRIKCLYTELLHFSQTHSLPEFFEHAMHESGFFRWIMQRADRVYVMNLLNSFFREVKSLASTTLDYGLQDLIADINVMIEQEISLPAEDLNLRASCVHILTAYKAKGLEWEHVFLVNCLDSAWSNKRPSHQYKLPSGIVPHANLDKKEKNEDERRVFYVALTRAKKVVYCSYGVTTITGDQTKQRLPAEFLAEIAQEKKTLVDVSALESNQEAILEQKLAQRPSVNTTLSDEDWIASLTEDLSIAPTKLNTYLECRYKYFLQTLLRIPRAQEEYMLLGTAVHAGLQAWNRYFREHQKHPPVSFLLQSVEQQMKLQPIRSDMFEKLMKESKKYLEQYMQEYASTKRKPLFEERAIGRGNTLAFGDVYLDGKLDVLEWIDESARTVAVVDYKTGIPKSKNDASGLTQKKDKSYLRQLQFYRLLLELDPQYKKYHVAEFVLDFVKKDDGSFKKIIFSRDEVTTETVQQEIRQMSADVRAGHFEKTTDKKVCAKCPFFQHCWPNEEKPKESY